MPQAKLTDRFGRTVNYVRLSVTDRCDFRCVYCMAEDMTFLPRQQVLTLEEIASAQGMSVRTLTRAFTAEFGASPMATLERLRCDRAKALLLDR